MEVQQFYYDNKIVKKFLYATMFWGIVGMSVGFIACLYVSFSKFNRWYILVEFWPFKAITHQRGYFCLCGKCHFCRRLLFYPAFVKGENVQRCLK